MNRVLRFHPISLALGLVLGGIAFLSMSQAIVATSPLRIEYAPHPRDMVQVREGAPYTVPAGRLFVLTALGSTGGTGPNTLGLARLLKVNGQVEVTTAAVSYIGNGGGGVGNIVSVAPVADGFTVPPGSVVEPFDSASVGDGRAWGYLAPQ